MKIRIKKIHGADLERADVEKDQLDWLLLRSLKHITNHRVNLFFHCLSFDLDTEESRIHGGLYLRVRSSSFVAPGSPEISP